MYGPYDNRNLSKLANYYCKKNAIHFMIRPILLLFICSAMMCLQSPAQEYTRQDSLRGSLNKYRTWWDVLRYDINVFPDYLTQSIRGNVVMAYNDKGDGHTMQLDLQQPMIIDSIRHEKQLLTFSREGNVYWVKISDSLGRHRSKPGRKEMVIYYHGTPRAAKNAPWDGGWIWKKDAQGRPWMSVACQGLGASVWFPCKDHQSDEPDKGASLTMNVPDSLVAIANGKLKSKKINNGTASYTWQVTNPINSYNIVPYIGKYVNFTEVFNGEKGKLSCSYWVLDYNLTIAKQQFKQAASTLKAFEHWFGPYPFYEDGFKLVEAPHLGMEHQSAVAYGNKYANGYLGRDLSGTGIGLKWDFIIVHEVGHEWFGNNITAKDIGDMWVHEGFTAYSEVLFTEYNFGKKDADLYARGVRKNILNNAPIIGPYGVNKEALGSDMYYKGSNLVHTIRQVINDDRKFRNILRGLNKTFYHQTVTTQQIEEYISVQSGKDLGKIFDQYLRHKKIPVLKMDVDGNVLKYKWEDAIDGFNMPVKLTNSQWLYPSLKWQEFKINKNKALNINADPNFYILVKRDD
jgi:aminopeptidase N